MFNDHRINAILIHTQDIPFYRGLYSNILLDKIHSYTDFIQIPIIDKNDIRSNINNLLKQDVDKKKLRMERTSGSTGRVLDIYWDKNDYMRSNKEIWKLRKGLHNINVNSRMLQFHPFIADNDSIYNTTTLKLSENILSFSWVDINEDNVERFHTEMNDFQPEWIYGPPSAIYQFAILLKKNNHKPVSSLKYIELTGDYVLDSHRELIDSFFNVSTSIMYGAREVNTIAYECFERHLHIVPENVFLEVLDEKSNPVECGETGNIVVTGLANSVMPFIRYKLGDTGYLLNGECCSCGNSNPIIVLESGRLTDIINLRNREPISAVIFWYAMQHINFHHSNPIVQFQVRQKKFDEFILFLVVREESNKGKIANYFLEFITTYNLVDSVEWDVKFVEHIYPSEKTGKLSYFINEIKEEE